MTNEEATALYFDNLYDFSNEDDMKRLQEKNQNLVIEGKPMFSFMMCVYNDMSLFNSAVNSLLKQNYTNWELVILDNSDKNPLAWDIIQNAVKADPRITAYKSEQNVGWAKGASVLLQYVKGEYTTFLAADDCINLGALEWLYKTVQEENPDVIWVGVAGVNQLTDHKMINNSGNIPKYNVYQGKNRSKAIVEIINTVYYNSFFHYVKVDFLKKYGIDFFEPYYGDCVGMTKAMVASDKMVVLDKLIYCLTMNTSQSRGRYGWGSYEYIFCNQWRCIREIFVQEHFNEIEDVEYVARRILRNFIGQITCLCQGLCNDKYMYPIEKRMTEIIKELEQCLESDEVAEMLQIAGALSFEKLLDSVSKLPIENLILYQDSWLYPLIMLSVYREQLSAGEILKLLLQWLLDERNPRCIGFDYCVSFLDTLDDSELIPFYEDINKLGEKWTYAEKLLFLHL